MKHARDKHKSSTGKKLEALKDNSFKTSYEFSTESRLRKYDTNKSDEHSVPDTVSQNSTKPTTKTKTKSKTKVRKKANPFLSGLKTVLVVLICVGLVVILGVGAGMYAAVTKEIDEMDFEGIAYNFSSTIYATDADGNSAEIEHLHSDGNREWIDSDKIPDIAKEAAISIEDERFKKHHGVDLKRTTGAAIGWVSSKVTGKAPSYGGSTITQQVIKNITQEKDRTVTRKIKEMMRAVAFEKRFTKDEILTMYLNIVYFGNQCYGVEAASKIYFSKSAIDLTLPQAAMIIGTTQAPSRFDPFKHPEDTLAKRNTVLKKMYELKKISAEEYEEAVNSDLGVNSKYSSLHSSVYNYFVDQVINDVISDLQTKKGYSQTFATQQVFSGGLKIYTTMDADIQNAMESVYTDTSNFPGSSKGTQSAMVIIDPYNGEIKGIVGGIGKKTESRGLNRATQSKRQPGSSIKPLSVYSTGLETGKLTPSTVITDEEITIGKWTPKNSYKGFKGDMTMRKAIEISANIPAVKALQTVGVESSYNFMTNKYHFTSLVNDDKNYSSLGLGGLTSGVSTKEMAAAYSVFANSGVYNTPHTYTKVLDSSGKVLLEYETETTRVLSEANAFIMTTFLSEVVNGSAGTGRNARLSNIATYGKTGTTNDNCDKWFVGFTPYYVGATWFGFDNMTPLTSVGISNNVSTAVWKKVMEKVHANLPKREFEQPDNVVTATICQRTGKLASQGCGFAKKEYFVKGTVPSKYCNNKTGKGATGAKDDKEDKATKKPTSSSSPNASEKHEGTSSEATSETTPETQAPTTKPATPKPAEPSETQSGGETVINLD